VNYTFQSSNLFLFQCDLLLCVGKNTLQPSLFLLSEGDVCRPDFATLQTCIMLDNGNIWEDKSENNEPFVGSSQQPPSFHDVSDRRPRRCCCTPPEPRPNHRSIPFLSTELGSARFMYDPHGIWVDQEGKSDNLPHSPSPTLELGIRPPTCPSFAQ
jgi:hypothetical protein